jgi:CubicO group peptidase (beta-lactamase class C family)
VGSPTASSHTESQKATPTSLGETIQTLLESAISDQTLAGAVVMASRQGAPLLHYAAGTKIPSSQEAPKAAQGSMSVDTVFDLGQMTQAICTATVLMRLVSADKIHATDRASRFLQALGVGQKSSITLAHLLSHTAGFPAGASVYEDLVRANAGPRPGILASSGAKQYAYTHFHNLPLKYEPGTRELVSDANYIVLGEICEIITGLPLEKAYARYVAAPLRVGSLNFIDLTLLRRKGLEPVVELFAPTGFCSRRERLLAGEVWDENAWVMGGVSGHCGLFGTARDVHTWATEILRGYRGESSLLSRDAVAEFLSSESATPQTGSRLGFATAARENGFVESKGDSRAFVTLGGTGCSAFVDPETETIVVFLTNAGFSGHTSRRFLGLRTDIHAAIMGLS